MSPPKGIDPVDGILARGRLPGSAYDAIFERVADRTAEARPALRRRWWAWVLTPAATVAVAAAAWLLLARPVGDHFARKGDPAVADPGVRIACAASSGPRCRQGDTLMFMVPTTVATGYLGAYAERSGDPGHDRIWYFPDGAGQSPLVSAGQTTSVLGAGIKIGAEHRPGKYLVTLWLASRPISRAEADHPPSGLVLAQSVTDLEIVASDKD